MTRPKLTAVLVVLTVLIVTIAVIARPLSVGAREIGSDGAGDAAARVDRPGDGVAEILAAPTAQATDAEDDDQPAWLRWSLGIWQLITTIALIIAGWKIFTKAGRAGWLSLIPIVNAIVLLHILDRPWWWLILYLIPIVGLIIWFVVSVDLAKAFGRSAAFGFFLIGLFSLIGILIIGFGEDKYRGRLNA